MSAAKYSIYIEQGAYWERTITVLDANEEPRNLDGFTAEMQIRRLKEDTAPLITLSTDSGITIDGPSGGIMIVITTAESAQLPAINGGWYDFELIDEFEERERLFQGSVTIDREVTR